ncbi:MAG TPA: hypothetical protein VF214_07185 [Edaphobacter sp.]
MRKKLLSAIGANLLLVGTCFGAVVYAQSKAPHLDQSNMPAALNGTAGSVTGYVRDIACPLRNHNKQSAHPPDDSCVMACAKAGAPLGIITSDGVIYNVISHTMPETDERQRLLPYVAKTVRATGRVFEYNGARAIAIDKIEVVSQ